MNIAFQELLQGAGWCFVVVLPYRFAVMTIIATVDNWLHCHARSVWFLLGIQRHRISGGIALQSNWQTSVPI